jgi:hypothetical protein
LRGHQWEPAEGTIVDVQSRHHEHHYTIDVRTDRGVLVRRTVKHRSPAAYAIGTKVRVEIDQDNEIRFDQNSPGGDPVIATMTMSDQIREASAAFDSPGVGGPNFGGFGSPGGAGFGGAGFGGAGFGGAGFGGVGAGAAGGLAGLIGELAGLRGSFGGVSGETTASVIGPDGQQLPFDASEMSQLTQALMSGDQAARHAAIQRLHQIRAEALGRMSGQQFGSDAIGTGSFDQISSPPSDGSASGFDAFGTDNRGTVEERLAKLQQLLSQGILTQSEYEAQRQRIIDGI